MNDSGKTGGAQIRLRQFAGGPSGHEPFDLTDRGLLLADGVFDTSRVTGGRIVLMQAHLDRLRSDGAALGIEIERETLKAFALEAVPDGGDGALRITLTRGPGPRGLAPDAPGEPTLISKFDPAPPAFPAPPVALVTSSIRRNPTAPSSRHKTLAYTDSIMGMRAAREAGFDDALYLTPDGKAACTSIANIFARFADRLVTPPLGDGVLNGVMRNWLMRTAAQAGFTVETASLMAADLMNADALYLTNSLQLVRPVSRLDGTAFDPGLPASLSSACRRLVSGQDD